MVASSETEHSNRATVRVDRIRRRPRYGIDAPKLVRAYIVSGVVLAMPALVDLAWPGPRPIPAPWSIGTGVLATLLLAYAGVMLRSSLVGKLRVRDRLVDALALSGNDHVLDAGCGRGLALIGCAKKLSTGKAIGIDLWAARDLSDNSPGAARANALAEGVADRVEVETGDITRLRFGDATFDAVISMTVIHNIPSQDGRDRAVREIARVLKPGGRIAIFDLLRMTRYAQILREAGLTVESLGHDWMWLLPCRSLLARKPEADTFKDALTSQRSTPID